MKSFPTHKRGEEEKNQLTLLTSSFELLFCTIDSCDINRQKMLSSYRGFDGPCLYPSKKHLMKIGSLNRFRRPLEQILLPCCWNFLVMTTRKLLAFHSECRSSSATVFSFIPNSERNVSIKTKFNSKFVLIIKKKRSSHFSPESRHSFQFFALLFLFASKHN